MRFTTSWARTSIRQRWLALLGITMLLGMIGGLALTTLAGARRTQSAYPRFLRSKNPSTLVVDVGSLPDGGSEAIDAISRLPQVVGARTYAAFLVARLVDGEPQFSEDFEPLGSIDGRFFDQDQFTVTAGRRPDPAKPDEIAVNETAAKLYGYHVGQQMDLATVSQADTEDPAFAEHPTPRLLTHATVVGIGSFIEEVVQDDTDRSPLLLLTPAYTNEAKGLETYAWLGLVLKHGDADVAAVKQWIVDNQSDGSPQIFRQTSIDTFHSEQAMRPISLSLGVFGLIAGLAAIVLVGQAISRHVRLDREQRAVARAIGAGPKAIALATVLGPIGAVLTGSVLAVVLAVVASPFMPIGPVRRVEVHRGIDVDATVLGFGALLLVATLTAVALVAALNEMPHRVQRRARPAASSGGRLVERFTSLPVAAVTGLRLAFESGEGATAVPVRSVMGGTAIAIAALVAAITFGGSLQHLVSHPVQYGWDWDVAAIDSAGYGNTDPAATQEILGGDPDIAEWSGAFFGADNIDGRNLPIIGMEPGSPVTPPIRAGRMVARTGEIVLGTATIGHLHKHVGDRVSSSSGPMTIVGTATLPSVSEVHGDHTSLGVGAIVLTQQVPGYRRNVLAQGSQSGTQTPADKYGPNILFIRFRPSADKSVVTKRLETAAERLGDSGGVKILGPQRSAEIVNAGNISGSSRLLGGAVAVAALTSLTVALTAAVRRRRRDLALLKSLGFTRGQLSGAVVWQATGTIVVGLIVGIPAGVASGRFLWRLFADQLDVLAAPVSPPLAIATVALGAVLVANVLAALPARLARRVPPALVLRSE